MPVPSLEERLSAIEKELMEIKQQMALDKSQTSAHPWEKVFGSFADSEGFDEAVRLGREYRESLHFDVKAAAQFERLRQARIRIGTMDLKIAAITLSNDAILLTRNLSDFGKIPDLRIEDWSS